MICFELFSFLTYNKYVNLNREVNTMKKIFIILSVLSLFVGCASKPSTEKVEVIYHHIEGNRVEDAKRPELDYNAPDYADTFVHKPIITKELFLENIGRFNDTREDFTKYETKRTNLSIRIINKTGEDLKLGFMSKDRSWTRWFYLNIPPYETKEFSIPDVITLGDSYIAMKHPEKWFIFNTKKHFNPAVREILRTHSFEFIYDNRKPTKYNEVGEADYSQTFDYSFIEPFECDNVLQEISWDDLSLIIGKTAH